MTSPAPVGTLASISLDCPDPAALADFYGALLGLQRAFETPDGGVIAMSAGGMFVTFMRTDDHVAPTWPAPGQQQQMHLDISVTELPAAVEAALALGATQASHQALPDMWRVLIDPAGHPFCLTTVAP
jgi:catechol 2,3-dioxygenase-like lactoylglutathione lyase family enzyme